MMRRLRGAVTSERAEACAREQANATPCVVSKLVAVCCPLARDADQIQDGGTRPVCAGRADRARCLDEAEMERAAALRKKRTFRKFLVRGVELEKLLDLNHEEFAQLIHARARRRIYRGLKAKPKRFVARLRRAKKACGPMDKPEPVKTHLRDMVVVPEMIGSVVGVYNGKVFNGIEVKPEMVGHYLGEFSITYKPVRHGRPGIGSTNSSRFIPLK